MVCPTTVLFCYSDLVADVIVARGPALGGVQAITANKNNEKRYRSRHGDLAVLQRADGRCVPVRLWVTRMNFRMAAIDMVRIEEQPIPLSEGGHGGQCGKMFNVILYSASELIL
jgi:hypothetical protein